MEVEVEVAVKHDWEGWGDNHAYHIRDDSTWDETNFLLLFKQIILCCLHPLLRDLGDMV